MNFQDMERAIYFRCDCGSLEHMFNLEYFEHDEDMPELFLNVELTTYKNIFQRIWGAILYVIGHKSRYGVWDEILINPKVALEMRNFINDYLNQSNIREVLAGNEYIDNSIN